MRGRSLNKSLGTGLASVLTGLLAAGSGWAVTSDGQDEGRDFDARSTYNQSFAQGMGETQAAAVQAMRTRIADFAMTWDEDFGIVSSISSGTTYLTGPARGANPLSVAMRFVGANLQVLGLSAADVSEYRITDVVYSRVTGATHIYAQQMHQGIPVYEGQLHINVNRDGRIISVNNAFVPNIAGAVNATRPTMDAAGAMTSVAQSMGMSLASAPQALGAASGVQQTQRFQAAAMSREPMTAKLMYLPVRAGEVSLVWNVGTMWTPDAQHSYEFNVDAQTGQVWTRQDSTRSATFRVYQRPVESPAQTTPLPPADSRTLAVNVENALASPNGWLAANSMSSTANNNVRACTDRDANNVCDATPAAPTCTGQVCDFAINLTAQPLQASPNAAITNLFYWNNIIHDIQYQYGFDEVAGNFQQNNFGRGGAGNDAVFAQAQDGSGTCNANFSTPNDGGAGRMQMFLCNRSTPQRDGDFDNGVITHEYGHGISTRQVGGPNRGNGCLSGQQQAGEGWSDWLGLVYTAKVGDTGPQVRGVGSYLFGLNPATGTIRDLPYSTNNAVNNWTYESIRTAGLPHGVGSRWAQAIWEVYWALTNKYGFEQDLINFNPNDPNEAGNKRAMLYINEGFKNTRCAPTFINNRDGVIQAAMDNFGGADVCLIWQAFAGFGLGSDARSATNAQTAAVNGFAVPAMCQGGGNPNPNPGQCTNQRFRATFDTTADGFVAGTNTCTTGQFVRGSPTAQTDGGVTTQVGGNAAGAGSLFTATNTSAGVNDVDGGTCEVRSPAVAVGAGSVTVNLSYFHGQRDAGGDDSFVIDVLNANNAVVSTIVNLGAATRNAAWTRASSTFNLGAATTLRLRVRAADGTASGDLVEGGIDEVQICGNPG
jgi:extracellular elastinolytic metalloproteinase